MRTIFLIAMIMNAIFFSCNFVSAEKISLTYSDHEPFGNMRTKFLNDVFFKEIEKISSGNITVIPHWNGELGISYDALKNLQDGTQVQISTIVPEYFSKELPLHQIFKSFPAGPTGNEQVKFFSQIYNEIPELLNEIENQNLKVIFVATGYPVAFFNTEKISSLNQLRRKKIRSASFWHRYFLKNFGSIPVNIRWGQEVFDALKNKTLDGLMVNIDSGYDINAHKVAPNILTSQKFWLGHEYIIAMNKNAYDKLSEDDKRIIELAAENSYKKLGKIMDESFFKQIELLKSEGVDLKILSDYEVQSFVKSVDYEKIQDKWAYENSAENVLNSVRKYMKKFVN